MTAPMPSQLSSRTEDWVSERLENDWRAPFSESDRANRMAKKGRPLSDMVKRAKERKQREKGEHEWNR